MATAVGFTIAIVLMAGIRESEFNDVPKAFQGFPIVLLTAGLMAIAFFGFFGNDLRRLGDEHSRNCNCCGYCRRYRSLYRLVPGILARNLQ